jgi:Outer membrane protein beta-barrel domain
MAACVRVFVFFVVVLLAGASMALAQADIYLKPRAVDSVKRNRNVSLFKSNSSSPYKVYLISRYLYNNSVFIPDQNYGFKYENNSSLGTTLGAYFESEYFVGAQVEVGLIEKNIGVNHISLWDSAFKNKYTASFHYSQQFIHVPVLLRINPLGSSGERVSLYFNIGLEFNFLVKAQNVQTIITSSGSPYATFYDNITSKMKATEICTVGSLGGSFRITNQLGFFMESRYGSGLTSVKLEGLGTNPPKGHINYWQVSGGLLLTLY